MNLVERRRSARVSASLEEAAVVYAGDQELLVRVIDFSETGALLSVVDLPGGSESSVVCGQRVIVSMNVNQSVFQVPGRVVRSSPGFVAVEFMEGSEKVGEKIRSTEVSGTFSKSS